MHMRHHVFHWMDGRKLKELERTPEKAWWDCVKNDMESLGLFQKDVQFNNKWRRIKGATG